MEDCFLVLSYLRCPQAISSPNHDNTPRSAQRFTEGFIQNTSQLSYETATPASTTRATTSSKVPAASPEEQEADGGEATWRSLFSRAWNRKLLSRCQSQGVLVFFHLQAEGGWPKGCSPWVCERELFEDDCIRLSFSSNPVDNFRASIPWALRRRPAQEVGSGFSLTSDYEGGREEGATASVEGCAGRSAATGFA
ncbi:hypothetical protein GW17_00050242 [Ensete ventricosum]|nr:hypothetical protein GW17_00050242 [Ensete ventricosum]